MALGDPCHSIYKTKWGDRDHTIEPKSRLNQWIQTKKQRKYIKSQVPLFILDKKVKYNDIQRSQTSVFHIIQRLNGRL